MLRRGPGRPVKSGGRAADTPGVRLPSTELDHRDDARDRRQRGASLIEYTLLVSLVVLMALAALEAFGGATAGQLSSTAEVFPD